MGCKKGAGVLALLLLVGCSYKQAPTVQKRVIQISDIGDVNQTSNAALVSCAMGLPMFDGVSELIDSDGLCPAALQLRLKSGELTQDELQIDIVRSKNIQKQHNLQNAQDQQFYNEQQQQLNSDLNSLNQVSTGAIPCGLHPRLCSRGF